MEFEIWIVHFDRLLSKCFADKIWIWLITKMQFNPYILFAIKNFLIFVLVCEYKIKYKLNVLFTTTW